MPILLLPSQKPFRYTASAAAMTSGRATIRITPPEMQSPPGRASGLTFGISRFARLAAMGNDMKLLDNLARRYLKTRGYHVPKAKGQNSDYILFRYTASDGSFDYERYRSIQIQGNKRKIENVWADEKTIAFISSYLKSTRPALSRGLCHGVRRGNEQRWFSEQLGIDVIGTDISDTASQFSKTVQWDFHEVNPEWVGAFDFVYTNSHDHAYDPKKALDAWVGQLRPGGALFLEHTMGHAAEGCSQLDPFGVDPHVFPFLIAKWGQGNYAVTDILEPEHSKPNGLKIWVFAVTRTDNSRMNE